MKYKLKIPIKILFELNESELLFQDINDVYELQDEYDVDLQHIIDEYEFKLEADASFSDDDSFRTNDKDVLKTVVDDNINDILDIFSKEVKLSYLSKTDTIKLVTAVQNSFNNEIMNFIPMNDNIIVNATIYTHNQSESYLTLSIDTLNQLFDDDFEKVKELIEIAYIDNWSINFEQIDHSDLINMDGMYVYVKFTPDALEYIN